MAQKLDLNALDITHNVYYQQNPENFLKLKAIVERNPKNYFRELLGKNQTSLLSWIDSVTPLLKDPFFKVSTKCCWILRNITEFPSCKGDGCQKVFNDRNVSLRSGYPDFCSYKCSNASEATKKKSKKTKFIKHGDENFTNVEKSRETRYKKNNGKWQSEETQRKKEQTCLANFGFKYIFSSPEFKQQQKEFNLENYGVEYVSQRPDVMEKILAKKLQKYGNKIGSYEKLRKMFTPEIRIKSMITCLLNYGVTNGGASRQAQLKAKRRYIYKGISFDSSPELAFYIWLEDNNVKFSYHCDKFFEYEYGGMTHRYYPDFYLEETNTFVEIKGDHFFTEDGKMFCPFRKKNATPEKIAEINGKYEAKHQCMLANGVQILRNADYKFAIDYVSQKYGADYLQKFRKQKAQHGNL